MPSTHCAGIRCCYPELGSRFIILFTHPTPHPPLFLSWKYHSGYGRSTPGRSAQFPSFLLANSPSPLPAEISIQWYLDGNSAGGTLEDVMHDLESVQHVVSELGLHLSHHKSEMIRTNPTMAYPILSSIPDAYVLDHQVPPYWAPLLRMCPPSLLSSMTKFTVWSPWVMDCSILPHRVLSSSATFCHP